LSVPLWAWLVFVGIVVAALAVDLLTHRNDHVIKFKEAAIWSAVWVSLAVAFGVGFPLLLDARVEGGYDTSTFMLEYFSAWSLEKALSVDNLFVFALILGTYFHVPREHQHKVLFYGVIGALVMRGVFLGAGVAVVQRFTFVLFIFAAILVWSAIKLLREGDDDEGGYDPNSNKMVKLTRRFVPLTDKYHGSKFFTKENGKRVGTPLLVVVVAIEAADLVFAVDSVPAVLAISDDPFIVYSSNAFAILGLRALYFLLSGLLDKFHYLGKGLAVVLAFIGVKLALQAAHEVISTSIPTLPTWSSLAVIALCLTTAVVASLVFPKKEDEPDLAEAAHPEALEESDGTDLGKKG
jgi:tellurite resistance protein TerC